MRMTTGTSPTLKRGRAESDHAYRPYGAGRHQAPPTPPRPSRQAHSADGTTYDAPADGDVPNNMTFMDQYDEMVDPRNCGST